MALVKRNLPPLFEKINPTVFSPSWHQDSNVITALPHTSWSKGTYNPWYNPPKARISTLSKDSLGSYAINTPGDKDQTLVIKTGQQTKSTTFTALIPPILFSGNIRPRLKNSPNMDHHIVHKSTLLSGKSSFVLPSRGKMQSYGMRWSRWFMQREPRASLAVVKALV
ncbi:hypothetical protein DSO57_1030754 [Entomophthora muscae]|uniref:Uncharacterized protein n=1 Tax=Entomophthora muscae TaxID=34485 RepID=A0ACC2T1B2_9FUNG|nr:hypothetical protein DSO57_1030754 [Entomophthora muscae]